MQGAARLPAPKPVRTSRVRDTVRFFRAFVKQPAVVGAFLPSSRALADAMLDRANLDQARTVVELGPGTGAVTGPILDRVRSSTLFLALELHQGHVRELRRRFPRLRVYRDSAEHLRRYLARYRRRTADTVVSGLPWANMSAQQQEQILKSVIECLRANGTFVTFGYTHVQWLPGARRFRDLLRRNFRVVEQSSTVWRNLPPALVYSCRQRVT
jgi:phospholipid N-methyltransferase